MMVQTFEIQRRNAHVHNLQVEKANTLTHIHASIRTLLMIVHKVMGNGESSAGHIMLYKKNSLTTKRQLVKPVYTDPA